MSHPTFLKLLKPKMSLEIIYETKNRSIIGKILIWLIFPRRELRCESSLPFYMTVAVSEGCNNNNVVFIYFPWEPGKLAADQRVNRRSFLFIYNGCGQHHHCAQIWKVCYANVLNVSVSISNFILYSL